MKRIDFSLGKDWGIEVYYGDELKRFVKNARSVEKAYGIKFDALDEPEKIQAQTIAYLVYVKDKSNLFFLVHELIHACTWVRQTTGMEDSPLQEWLAYSVEYCLRKLVK